MPRRPLQTQAWHGALKHNGDDSALHAIKPPMRLFDSGGRERREDFGAGEKCREPFQPQQNPAVNPLEPMGCDGWGVDAHERDYAVVLRQSD